MTDTRQRMIRATARLMRRQGYAATGWRQVVADSATPWGSQFHHFPGGKEQLAAEAVALAGRRYEQLLRAALGGRHPAEAVASWVELAAAELEASGWADGCPVATVALETAHTSAALAERARQRSAAGTPPSPRRSRHGGSPARTRCGSPPWSWPASRAGSSSPAPTAVQNPCER